MYKVIVFASFLVLFGCGQKDTNASHPGASEQVQDNKAVTVKKASESTDRSLQELKENKHDLKW